MRPLYLSIIIALNFNVLMSCSRDDDGSSQSEKIKHSLTVSLVGDGQGVVSSVPSGIDCGVICGKSFDENTVVHLQAVASVGSEFAGWSGDADCSDGVVTLQGDVTCQATFNLFNNNHAPVANAGSDQTVTTNNEISLDGSASSDADANAFSYHWYFVAVPQGSKLTGLRNAYTVAPSFTPDVDGLYSIALVVNDGLVDSAVDTVDITASSANVAPIADAGFDQSVRLGNSVTLDASKSHDANGDALKYQWDIVSLPNNSQITITSLSSTSEVMPTFLPDVAGVYEFSLLVNDYVLDSAPDNVKVTVSDTNSPPIADAGGDQYVVVNSVVNLDGSASYDPEGSGLTYLWFMSLAPPGSKAINNLLDSNTATPSFNADFVGHYQLTLFVNDSLIDSNADVVNIHAYPTLDLQSAYLQNKYLSVKGPEYASSGNSILIGTGTVNYNLIGAVFCSPQDPYAAPLINSIPPSTVYGCENNLSLNYSVSPDRTVATFSATFPVGYVDFSAFIAGLNISVQGYGLATNLTATVDVAINDAGNNVFQFAAIGASSSSFATTEIHVNNPLVQLQLTPAVQQDIATSFADTLKQELLRDIEELIVSQPEILLP